MNINIKKFKKFVKKSTLNYSIESLQIVFDKEKISSKMASPQGKYIVLLECSNDIFTRMDNEKYVLNFMDPSQNLVPFLNTFDDDIVDVKIESEKMILSKSRQKINIFFCSPSVVSTFNLTSPRAGIVYFTTLSFDDDLIESFNKIKKVGMKFGKVYFTVKDKKIYIETTDKLNRLSNGIIFKIGDIDINDLSICFDYKDIFNLLTVLDFDSLVNTFKISITYMKDQNLGMLYIFNNDETERFYLMSFLE